MITLFIFIFLTGYYLPLDSLNNRIIRTPLFSIITPKILGDMLQILDVLMPLLCNIFHSSLEKICLLVSIYWHTNFLLKTTLLLPPLENIS